MQKRWLIPISLLSFLILCSFSTIAYQFTVDGTKLWQDSGVYLNKGDVIKITASGIVYFCNGQTCPQEPDGDHGIETDSDVLKFPCHKDGYVSNLIAKIGEGQCFNINKGLEFTADTTGKLFLATNDYIFGDNSGNWDVRIDPVKNDIFYCFDGANYDSKRTCQNPETNPYVPFSYSFEQDLSHWMQRYGRTRNVGGFERTTEIARNGRYSIKTSSPDHAIAYDTEDIISDKTFECWVYDSLKDNEKSLCGVLMETKDYLFTLTAGTETKITKGYYLSFIASGEPVISDIIRTKGWHKIAITNIGNTNYISLDDRIITTTKNVPNWRYVFAKLNDWDNVNNPVAYFDDLKVEFYRGNTFEKEQDMINNRDSVNEKPVLEESEQEQTIPPLPIEKNEETVEEESVPQKKSVINKEENNENILTGEAILPLNENVCNGCTYKEKCLLVGTRISTETEVYCDIDWVFRQQSKTETACDNNYECKTNLCSNQRCIDLSSSINEIKEDVKESKGLLTKIWGWIKKLF